MLLHLSCGDEKGVVSPDQQAAVVVTRLGKVNDDHVRYEDRVSEVRMLIFDPFTGYCNHNALLRFEHNDLRNNAYPVEITPGRYHFLFVGNETASSAFATKIGNVRNVSDLDDVFFKTLPYSGHFHPDATSDTGKFLMSAYYGNVYIPPGSTTVAPHTIPVSLVRAFARIELVIKNENGSAGKQVKNVHLTDLPRTFVHPADGRSCPADGERFDFNYPVGFTESDYRNAVNNGDTVGTTCLYIPEYIVNREDARNPVSLEFSGIGFLNDSIGLTTPASLHEVINAMPILLDAASISRNSVVRNVNYKVTANLTPSDLKTTIEVLPWEYIPTAMDFDAVGFDFSMRVDEVETGSGLANKEVTLASGQTAVVTFTLHAPAGAKWKATLTNGYDFAFTGATQGNVSGGVGTYSFEIEPRNAWNGTVKYSEFYISVSGVELELLGDGISGVNRRYCLRQIE